MAVDFIFDLDGYPDQTQRVVVDNKTFDFRFVYNSYGECWRLFISEPGAEPLCSFKLTAMTEPLSAYQYSLSIPQGIILAGGVVNMDIRLSQDNVGVGKSAFLWYLS